MTIIQTPVPRLLRPTVAAMIAVLVAGCASGPSPEESAESLSRQVSQQQQTQAFNVELTQRANQFSQNADDLMRQEYKVGRADLLEISVFQVDALNTRARVNAKGQIMLPLLGVLDVEGKPVSAIESMIRDRLAADYIRDPQVSVFIAEYRSSEVAVSGAVSNPAVYSLKRPRTLLEVLTMAGGLTTDAGYKAHVQTKKLNPDTGAREPVNLVVDLRELTSNFELNRQLVLTGGDSIFVAKAGFVYVQGAVGKPGAYAARGGINVLKAVTQAGGAKFEAAKDEVRVYRAGAGEQGQTFMIDLDEIREHPQKDIALQDGDIVLVGRSGGKSALAGIWDGIRGIVNVSAGYAIPVN